MNDARPPLLELVEVSKRYGSLEVLKDISLKIGAGESVAIVGPSGSGKSTLLNLMGTLDAPTSGKVLFEGTDVGSLGERELTSFRNRVIGFIFQNHHLLPQLTALENVLIPTLVTPREDRAGAAERARELLGRVGLAERLAHRPSELSGGECQRIAVVRAIINRPRLLLADEPTGSLDRRSSAELVELLSELNREEGIALVVITHADGVAERQQRIFELAEARLVGSRGPS